MLSPRLTRESFEVRLDALQQALGRDNLARLLKGLTVRERPLPGAPAATLARLRTVQCYRVDAAGVLHLPRRLAPRLLALIAPGAPPPGCADAPGHFGGEPSLIRRLDEAAAAFAGDLYPYQEAYVDYVCRERLDAAHRRAGAGQVYVHAQTGQGKTAMALALVSRLRVPALVVVPTKALQNDGVAAARRFLPGLRAAAYSNDDARRRARRGEPPLGAHNADVVYCVVNTAREKPPEFFRGFGIVILDEAHEYQSACSARLLWTAQAPCVVGLSATPDERADGLDRALFPFLGPPLSLESVVPPGLIEDVGFAGRVREVRYVGHPEHAENVHCAGTVSAILTIGRVVADPHRLELVASEVKRLLELHETLPAAELAEWGLGAHPETGRLRRHCVFVFAEHRAYLPALRAVLARRLAGIADLNMLVEDEGGLAADLDAPAVAGAEPAFDADALAVAGAEPAADAAGAVILRGGATDAERAQATQTRLVLTTYGFSRRGISLDQMTALVLASPRKSSMMQVLGRICRLAPDLALRSVRRVVVDVVDTEVALAGQAPERRKAYARKDWPVHRLRARYDQYPLDGSPACEAPGHAAEALLRPRAPASAEPEFTLADLQ